MMQTVKIPDRRYHPLTTHNSPPSLRDPVQPAARTPMQHERTR